MNVGNSTLPLTADFDEARDRPIYDAGFIPGWLGEGGLRPEPEQDFLPHRWRWEEGRSLLEAAAECIDPEKSERRNIRMANPATGKGTSLNTIHCSYQMVVPGEFVRAHRHTVNAGRFVLESDRAFTTLDGEKVYLEKNDIILTPNWIWHGLGNDSDRNPGYWVDFLDDPLVSLLKPTFFQVRQEHGATMPVREGSPYHVSWKEMQAALDGAAVDPDGFHGRRCQVRNEHIPSMGLYMERLAPGERTEPFQSTASRLFVCVEGEGTTDVAGVSFAWRHGDVIAVPSWKPFHHRAGDEATLFEITDQPVLEAFNWYREDGE